MAAREGPLRPRDTGGEIVESIYPDFCFSQDIPTTSEH